ncbi:hydroxypyruvate isomerase family protein [Allopusillimonas ginsengisoli]|uniref:hydroxypyruvate isomerase family protein n=1 Tax=Allopusillimonas ginsengisoli TaxID=453575 RepID=UPI0010C1C299|nr:hydroxypyruvate isomerase [Allopusillimonas ginsengisoli]
MKLAANLSLLYPGLPISSRMACAARDGFTGVEILFPYDVEADELAYLLRKQRQTLVLINTPPGPKGEKGLACLPGREAEFMRAMRRALAVCEATGCRSIHVLAGMIEPDSKLTLARSTLIHNLRMAATLAEEADVTLTLEALNRHDMPGYFYHLPEQAADILQAVDHPAVRLQFDFYHSQREGLDLPAELRKLLPLVHHVQFANPQGRHEPDLSDPQVRAALSLLASSGYDGWIGCEYTPVIDARTGLAWRDDYQALLDEARP